MTNWQEQRVTLIKKEYISVLKSSQCLTNDKINDYFLEILIINGIHYLLSENLERELDCWPSSKIPQLFLQFVKCNTPFPIPVFHERRTVHSNVPSHPSPNTRTHPSRPITTCYKLCVSLCLFGAITYLSVPNKNRSLPSESTHIMSFVTLGSQRKWRSYPKDTLV